MNKEDIKLLYKYNQWANTRILNAASKVSPEEFLAPAPYPHGGLRGTLVHALFGEWVWRKRWEGSPPTQRLKPEDFPTFRSMQERWAEEENLLMNFVDDLTDEQLNSVFNYTSLDGNPHQRILWQAMAHLVNHGTQHRTEAAAMLTGMGQSPGDIDLILFLIETQSQKQE
jgi:uncharacterized damage-inducible protein DinB